jgi:hypothetical protein
VPWEGKWSSVTLINLIPTYVQATALVVAGLWAYWRFFHQRGDEPATDIEVDARFVGRQGDHYMVEVTATLENKSFVRHRYRQFRMNLRYLRTGDELVDGAESVHHQVVFPHSIDERIDGRKRLFANAAYINPRQRFHHRYETFVPSDATFIRVHCRFEFEVTGPRAWRQSLRRHPSEPTKVDSQKVFRVPCIDGSEPPRDSRPGGV